MRAVSSTFCQIQPSRELVWRGQDDADYGLSSSLFRKALSVYSMRDLNESMYVGTGGRRNPIRSRLWFGAGMTNLQLLHALQHYRLPTRLIDVSRSAMPALWFASSGRQRKDGRLFLFAVPRDSVRPDDRTLQMVPWRGIKLSNWTNKVLLLDAPASNPRLSAQDGAFLVGGLARNYAGQQRLTKDKHGQWRYVPAEQIHEISELFVKFPQQLSASRIRRWNSAETYGVTWRIPADCKPTLLKALRLLRISNETMYPDFDAARAGIDETLRFA